MWRRQQHIGGGRCVRNARRPCVGVYSHTDGTWSARGLLSSSAWWAKGCSGTRPSAQPSGQMNTMRVVEIRSYKLKPNSSDVFHALVAEQSVPLHRAAGIDVVAYGTSLHDADAYFLIRAYDSMEHLRRSQDTFYASPAWRQGPREAIIALIESDANAVLWLGAQAIEGMRGSARAS